jgi:hypothetical protein
LRQIKAYSQKGNGLFCFSPLTTHALRLTVSEMAQNRLEECLQGLAGGEEVGNTKRVRVISEFHKTCVFVSLRWKIGCIPVSSPH